MKLSAQGQLKIIVAKAYRQGFLDSLQAYAYQIGDEWKVGNNGISLKEATHNLDDSHYFNPASAHKVVDQYIDTMSEKIIKGEAPLPTGRDIPGEELMQDQEFHRRGREALNHMLAELEHTTNLDKRKLLESRILIVRRALSGELSARQTITEAVKLL